MVGRSAVAAGEAKLAITLVAEFESTMAVATAVFTTH